ncbi:DUF1931 family protein [Rhodococcus wratislaviensis]|nr:DUF1931 family protein [Rhodococcus sp. 3A]MBC2897856.1 DUF1931 family protein [Rhodococcus sp. 4CII]
MTVMTVATFQTVFRETAGLYVEGSDLPRCNAVLTRSLYRLLLTGQRAAADHHRYIIEPDDLPVTRGLEENITHFRRLGHHLDPERILAQLATYPPLDRIPASGTEARFPDLVGGLTVTLARTLTVIAPGLARPGPAHWETLRSVADLYL